MSASFCEAEVISNQTVCDKICLMRVKYGGKAAAGQFFMLRCWKNDEPPLLSRPISVHDYENGVLSFLYEVKGIGTEKLAALKPGEKLSLTGPSGNGFPLDKIKGRVAVVAGGIGIAPLLYLVKSLTGCKTKLFCGFRDKSYATESFKPYVEQLQIATDSGSEGVKGFVTSLFNPADYDVVVCCGPDIMMKKVTEMCLAAGVKVYVSKESKMACGVGACLGCTCKTKHGGKSICKDGPVFEGGEVYFDE